MLAGARLGDDALLAHALGEQDLAKAVVDLVRAGVVQFVALEVDLGAAEVLRQPLGEVKRARPAGIVGMKRRELGMEGRIVLGFVVGRLQLQDQRHQRFGHEASAIEAEMAFVVGAGAVAVQMQRRVYHRGHEAFPYSAAGAKAPGSNDFAV